MSNDEKYFYTPPVCCGKPTASVNCFDHREWLCVKCRRKHGLAPNREPEWETMTIGKDEVGSVEDVLAKERKG